MIKKAASLEKASKENMRGGDGTVKFTYLASKEELLDKARMYSIITLEPGCSIGYHVHEGECEIFYVKKGTAVYNDNGTEKEITVGDVTVCPSGSGHGVANRGSETVELVALIPLQ